MVRRMATREIATRCILLRLWRLPWRSAQAALDAGKAKVLPLHKTPSIVNKARQNPVNHNLVMPLKSFIHNTYSYTLIL
jgi:hypothetical protein